MLRAGARLLPFVLIACAILGNEFFVRRFSSDRTLEPSSIATIRWTQFAFAAAGLASLLRKRAILIGLFLVLAALNLHALHTDVSLSAARGQVVTEGNLRLIRQLVSLQERVGYIGDEAPPKSNEAVQRFYLTQYAVVPVILEPGADQKFVIGNFQKFSPKSIPSNLEVVRDFGGGLMLFQQRLR